MTNALFVTSKIEFFNPPIVQFLNFNPFFTRFLEIVAADEVGKDVARLAKSRPMSNDATING